MKKLPLVIAAMLAVVLVVPPAAGITNGELDAANHYPFVGLIVLEIDGGVGPQCSGALVAPQVFVTAGHCTYNALNRWLATRLWISFAPTFDETDPFAGPLVDVTGSEGLAGHVFWHPGYEPPHAAYSGAPKHDVGVIWLPEPVVPTGNLYAQLPTVGRIAQLRRTGGLGGLAFTSAGYGCVGKWPAPAGPAPWGIAVCDFDRRIGSHAFVALTDTWVKVSQNFPSSGSSGGAPGDSGTPVFLGSTPELVGSMFDGGDLAGTGFLNVMRFDERSNHDFITSFIGT